MPLVAAPVFIGTNTGGKSASKGIYLADFDMTTGKLTPPELAAEYGNPGFLALHPAKPILYAIGAAKSPFPDGTGAVAAFSISADNKLSFIGECSSGGNGPCHLAVDATGSTLAIANYGDGKIATVHLDGEGKPVGTVSIIANSGSGPNKRQDGPHAHGVYFDLANKNFFVPDLGLDQVLVYQFSPATSEITGPGKPFKTAAGAGPRHMAFTADEKHAYVINELDQTVTAARYNPAAATFTTISSIPTLPAGFDAANKTSEIEVHPNGKFVYGSNRGHDSIVVYRRDENSGELALVQHAPCGGATPRHFKIAPGGKWLLCAHQDSNSISVLPLDPATGKLGAAATTVDSPSPICLLFGR